MSVPEENLWVIPFPSGEGGDGSQGLHVGQLRRSLPPVLGITWFLLGLNHSRQTRREVSISSAFLGLYVVLKGGKSGKLFLHPSLFLVLLLSGHGVKLDSMSIIIKM